MYHIVFLYYVVVAKLTRLEQIAAENAVYMQKMRQRFRHSNIVGVDSYLGQSSRYLLLLWFYF